MKITSVSLCDRDSVQTMTQITDNLYIDIGPVESSDASITITFVTCIANTAFKFVIDDANEADRDMLGLNSSPMNEVVYKIINDTLSKMIVNDYVPDAIPSHLVAPAKLSLQKACGELADSIMLDYIDTEGQTEEKPDETQAPAPDPNLLYTTSVSTHVFTLDKRTVNWDDTISQLDNIMRFKQSIKMMIHDLCVNDIASEEYENIRERVNEVIHREEQNTGIQFVYDKFKDLNTRELLLAKLFDIDSFYEVIIDTAKQMKAQIDTQSSPVEEETEIVEVVEPEPEVEEPVPNDEYVNHLPDDMLEEKHQSMYQNRV